MLLSSSPTIPRGDGWPYELKWDGYRGVVTIVGGAVDIRSRHGTDMLPWFPELAALPARLSRDVVLDGEVVSLDERGHPDFYSLRRTFPTFVAFDVLQLDGTVTDRCLRDRHALLAEIVVDAPPLLLRSRPFVDGAALLEQAERLGLEGIVAKRVDQPYRPGERVRHWVKVKTSAGRAEAARRLQTSFR